MSLLSLPFIFSVILALVLAINSAQPPSSRKRILFDSLANSNNSSDCIQAIPNANTRYVAVLNPGVPVRDATVINPHIIEVMIVYTAAARALRGGSSQTMTADAHAMIQKTNSIYQNSKIPARVNLAYVFEATNNYKEGVNILQDLNRVTDGFDGPLDEVHALRQCVGADVVILLTSPNAPGQTDAATVIGAAWFRSNSPAFDGTGFAPFAFAVVRYNVISSGTDIVSLTSQTFAHEIGHITGCLHDVASHSESELSLLRERRAVGHFFTGAQDGQSYRTIMSARSGARRIDVHANHEVFFQGSPTGQPNIADCAAFLSKDLGFVSAFLSGPHAGSCPPDLVGCDGVPLSGLQFDQCGVCGGNGECLDCEGVSNGGKTLDCAGVCGGGALTDCTGVCNGDAIVDCAGVCNGRRVVDCAGVCGGVAQRDCASVCNGNAYVDDCGVCAAGSTGLLPNIDKDCAGICGGSGQVDECGVCNGDGTTCVAVCNCPMVPDYWRTHHCFAPVPARVMAWPAPYSSCLDTVMECEGDGLAFQLRWIDVLYTPTDRSNAWLILAKQWIAARLNLANTPCLSPSDLIAAMDEAQSLLEAEGQAAADHPSLCLGDVPLLSSNSPRGLSALALASQLSLFNERKSLLWVTEDCLELSMSAQVDERCEGGCTKSAEYWSTHHAMADSPSLRIPWPSPSGGNSDHHHSENAQVCPGETKLHIIQQQQHQQEAGDVWVQLARQSIAGDLNVLAGSCITKEAADAMVFAKNLLERRCRTAPLTGHEPVDPNSSGNDVLTADMRGLASVLLAFNRGELGPGECGTSLTADDDSSSSSVAVCEGGCTHSVSYWAAHHLNGTRESLRQPWPAVDDGSNVPSELKSLCDQTWLQIMLSPPPVAPDYDLWTKLAQQWIAAKLSTLAGACLGRTVNNALLVGIQVLGSNCQQKLPAGDPRHAASREAALEVVAVLEKFNSGCGGLGPYECVGDEEEMRILVIDGNEAIVQLEEHQQQCEEEKKCKDEKRKADSYLTWAVIVTIILVIFMSIFLMLVLWSWWVRRRREMREIKMMEQGAKARPRTEVARGKGTVKGGGGGGGGGGVGNEMTHRYNTQAVWISQQEQKQNW